MRPWEHLGEARIPDGARLSLHRRHHEWVIRVDGHALMNSSEHASEDALGHLPCMGLKKPDQGSRGRRVLVGGLGMGFTLAAALKALGPQDRAVVAEIAPEVVAWNRGPLGELAGQPLQDPRTEVQQKDVGLLIRGAKGAWDAILLDVDNSPDGLSRRGNQRLYAPRGLGEIHSALRAGGVLAVWSAVPDPAFLQLLKRTFRVEEQSIRARPGKGPRHTIWLAWRR